MIQFVVVSLLIGMVLGQRFKVLVLLPAFAFAIMAAICLGIARADTPFAVALLTGAAIVSLQLGYLAGIAIRYLTILARASRRRAVRSNPLAERHAAH